MHFDFGLAAVEFSCSHVPGLANKGLPWPQLRTAGSLPGLDHHLDRKLVVSIFEFFGFGFTETPNPKPQALNLKPQTLKPPTPPRPALRLEEGGLDVDGRDRSRVQGFRL